MKIIVRHRLDEMMAAPPSRLVVMLYDEAIGALKAAVAAATRGDIEARCNAVTAATEIVGYLYMNLDLEQGGEVAANLGAIYGHIMHRLPRINLYNDVDTAEEAISLLEPLRDSWNELDCRIAAGDVDEPTALSAARALRTEAHADPAI